MPVRIWKGAVLVYKGARYIVPIVIAATGFVMGLITGRKTNKQKGN